MASSLGTVAASTSPSGKKISCWRKLGGGSLTISLIVHGVILAIGVVIVVQTIAPKVEEEIDIAPTQTRVDNSPSATLELQTKASPSALIPVLTSNVPLDANLPESGPAASPGEPSAPGSGNKNSIGGGSLPGLPGNTDPPVLTDSISHIPAPFGTSEKKQGLVGALYDLKQTRTRKLTGIDRGQFVVALRDFVKSGWKEQHLKPYFKAPDKLIQTSIFIPNMSADEAPAAFKCEKDVQPRQWLVVYRGTVTAPKSGNFRFVGAADDVMAVRFNEETVFDYGFTTTTLDYRHPRFRQETLDKATAREARQGPMTAPLVLRSYPSTGHYNQLGGLATGREFSVVANTSYPIEILISEIPGGIFGAALLIEEMGVSYRTTPQGQPVLPVFRTTEEFPQEGGANLPPFEKNSPVWKVTSERSMMELPE